MPKMSSALLFCLISLACLTGAQVSQPLVDENQLETQNNETSAPPEWSDKMDFRQSVVEPMGSMVIYIFLFVCLFVYPYLQSLTIDNETLHV